MLDKLAERIEARRFPDGAKILRAGGPASFMGIVFAGRASVRVVNAMTGEYTVQQELRVGDHFGEIAAVLSSAQPYEVVAESEATVLLVPKNLFEWLTSKINGFSLSLAKGMASRLVRAGVTKIGGARVVAPPTRAGTRRCDRRSVFAGRREAVCADSPL